MAITEFTIAKPVNQSPELSTALLKLEYTKILFDQFRAIMCHDDRLKAESNAMLREFSEPFLLAIQDSFQYLIGQGDELGQFFERDLPEMICQDREVVYGLTRYSEGFLMCGDMESRQKSELLDMIATFVSYGFVAGMMFSGQSGATIPEVVVEENQPATLPEEATAKGTMAAVNNHTAEETRSLARAYCEATKEMNSFAESEQKSEACNEAYKLHRRTLDEFLGSLPVFDFFDLDRDIADGLADHILTARVKLVANG